MYLEITILTDTTPPCPRKKPWSCSFTLQSLVFESYQANSPHKPPVLPVATKFNHAANRYPALAIKTFTVGTTLS